MIIRNDQILAFNETRNSEFIKETKARLLERFPEETQKLSSFQLEQIINHGIEIADSYKIEKQNDVARFIEILFAYSPSLTVDLLGKENLEYLEDYRFNAEDRLDFITMQIALDNNLIKEPSKPDS